MKILLFFLAISFCPDTYSNPMTILNSKEELRSYLNKRHYSGVILVAEKNKILMREAFGFKDITSTDKILVEDKFQIGSNTKQMVAAGLLKLQEQGKLSLDDLISKYIIVPESYSKIRIKDVLNHSAGISNFTEVDSGIFWKTFDKNKLLTLEDILNFTFKYPLDFNPTTNWKYSNTGYIIAGKIIEIVSGQKWDAYLEQNFFSPLLMNDTGHSDSFESVSSVKGHMLIKGELKTVEPLNMTWALSAGSLYSNVDDLLKWARTFTSPTVISEKSLDEMMTPFLQDYGLGIRVTQTHDGDLYISHGGRTPGFVSKLSHLKKRDMTFISLDNNDGIVGDIDQTLLTFFTKGTVTVTKAERINLSRDELLEYEGKFIGRNLEIDIYVEGDRLFLFPKNQMPYAMEAIEKDNFDLGFAAEEFIRDSNGKIIELKHYQNGGTSIFKKQ